jgi:hypothetical protein
MENVEAIKKCLIENLPGGEENIKSMFLKSTDQMSIPIYQSALKDPSVIKLANNMTVSKVKRAKKFSVTKRLKDSKGGISKNKKKLNRKQNLKLAKVVNLAAVQKAAAASQVPKSMKSMKVKKVEKMIE